MIHNKILYFSSLGISLTTSVPKALSVAYVQGSLALQQQAASERASGVVCVDTHLTEVDDVCAPDVVDFDP